MSRDTSDDKSSYVIGNGLVPSSNKPFPKPILTQIYGAIWRHQATNEVKYTPRMRPKVSGFFFFSFMVVWALFSPDPLELPNGCPNASKTILEDVTRTHPHYTDVIMTTMASQITSLTVVYSTVYSDAVQRKHQSPRHWPLCGEFTGTGEFPAQRASYAENVSIWWRHHVAIITWRRTDVVLTHWSRVTHICVSKQTIIG